jgi:16S rRNA G966 N2-methylase RsmD
MFSNTLKRVSAKSDIVFADPPYNFDERTVPKDCGAGFRERTF